MSREIHIGYRSGTNEWNKIDVRPGYCLFGHQETSKEFWSLPQLRDAGIEHLTVLGHADPIYFVGWKGMTELEREIGLWRTHLRGIDFDPDRVAVWLAHLTYAHALLVLTAPPESQPELWIG